MNGKLKHEYELEETGEVFNLEIEYDYVPYHPADRNGPAEGGGCEEITFKVIGYRQYDEEGKTILNWPVLTLEQGKSLTAKFDKYVEDNQWLYEHFQEICDAEAEMIREHDNE